MQRITHIEALTSLAIRVKEGTAAQQVNSASPVSILAKVVGLEIKSTQFLRILMWLIAFYNDGMETISNSGLSDKNRDVAEDNTRALFSPFLPPFGNTINQWFSSNMSATNQSYFDLLSDAIIDKHPIYVPEPSDITSYANDLNKLLQEMESLDLPRWINNDFKAAIELTLIAIEKLPFLAHRIIQDSHSTILSKLLLVAKPEHKKFMVRVATTINIILAAFVMPHEATDAAASYYGWAVHSPADIKQIEACAAPLALPAPEAKAKK